MHVWTEYQSSGGDHERHLLDDWGREWTGSILRGMGGSWCWFYFLLSGRQLLDVYKLNIGNYNIIILYLLYIYPWIPLSILQ